MSLLSSPLRISSANPVDDFQRHHFSATMSLTLHHTSGKLDWASAIDRSFDRVYALFDQSSTERSTP